MRELGRVEGTAGKDLQLTLDLGRAGLRDAAHGRRERRRRGDRRDQRRHRRARLGAGVRSQQLRLRHHVGRVERAPERRLPAARRTRPSPAPTRPARPSRSAWRWRRSRPASSAPATASTAPAAPTLGNRRFHCWKRGGHGRVDLRRSLAQSCDCYYYEMGRRARPRPDQRHGAPARARRPPRPADAGGLGGQHARRRLEEGQPRRELDHRRQLQLRHRPGLHAGLAAAARGDDGARRQRHRGQAADPPRGRRRAGAGRRPPSRSTSRPQHLHTVRDGMFAVSNEGTAYRSRIVDPAMLMAGKTGTSQVRIITAAERAAGVTKNEQLPWNRRDHALFVCLRALRQAALRRRPDRRARRRRLGGGGADRPRHPALRALRRPAAARGLSRRPARGDRGAARACRPAPAAEAARAAPARDRA